MAHRYSSRQHSSACLVCVCLCIKTAGFARSGLGVTLDWPQPQPLLGRIQISVQTLCNLGGFWLTPAPWRPYIIKIGLFWPSESHQLCFCWASRLTTDFCIILLLIHPHSSLSISSKIKFQPLIPIFKYQKRIIKASGRCFPSSQPFPAGTTSH